MRAPGIFAPGVSAGPSGVGVGPLKVVPGPPAVTQAPSSGWFVLSASGKPTEII